MSVLTPTYGSKNFLCPNCNVAAEQTWFTAKLAATVAVSIMEDTYYAYRSGTADYQQTAITNFMESLSRAYSQRMIQFVPGAFALATCGVCSDPTIWMNQSMVHPRTSSVTSPNSDMSDAIKELYAEAATIVTDSPRGATALLRLALQLLLKQLGKSGKDINADIKDLVAEGLSPKIQQALDVVRVVGNNAVHPGQIDLNDGRNVALRLFQVLNFIADEMITKPKELAQLYTDVVPEETQGHIRTRDGKGK